ncbi:2-amino-4-hydroxy-6-hydroxymethyldihydropteridine diphosphokinase [Paraflavitalea soli]|uniref:2-amino-4-hydroxy-6-hydroxymethyldihydropteridine pyrophosphokinase n=1 Tax=Paraflavitalea soli TaxID=2315862 RepID=A0A3B7MLA8_9BACT|nr:2-amino-4-hydroxy-6-hydroxymethyldihydropteridine diphosphokinase [Paraflavitalea soli]AXY75262.1 2-amino-4-hydroxy-6-hydroxymethyldihydropteridine diphosphokinase [Paraflavitalea soli]
MNNVYLLIGGNVGNRAENLQQAIIALNQTCGRVVRQSAIYETAAWGKTDQQPFLNQALLLVTRFTGPELLQHTMEAENVLGRVRQERYGPRIIDIDILFFNNDIIREPALTIPHPEVQNRRFALTPLDELAPDLVHPVLQKTVHQLLDECKDELEVKVWNE